MNSHVGLNNADFHNNGVIFLNNTVEGLFQDIRLKSVFQPLLSVANQEVIGYEALLRANDLQGHTLSPEQVFSLPSNPDQLVYLDRLCRKVHVLNFIKQNYKKNDLLFLNVDGKHLTNIKTGYHGAAFENFLTNLGIDTTSIVLEILESRVEALLLLQEALNAYQKRGFKIAIDDFGIEHSNFDRLWLINPDIVKLDRSLIAQAEVNPKVRKVLPSLVKILHDLEAKVVSEGIENEDQWLIARDSGVDFVQGFFFAKPTELLWRN